MQARDDERGQQAPSAQKQQHAPQQQRPPQQQAFRDKVKAAGEEQAAARLREQQALERRDGQSLAVGMLVEGRPQAFVDFFELTHSTSSGTTATATSSSSQAQPQQPQQPQQQPELPPEGLHLLAEMLVRADAALKAGDPGGAFGACKRLGRYFAARSQLEQAVTFYSKCRQVGTKGGQGRTGALFASAPSQSTCPTCFPPPQKKTPHPRTTTPKVARASGWVEGELESSCALGLVYEQLRQPDAAVACHERCLELALSAPGGADSELHADEARRTLVHVYALQV
jgi:hypothetical protein